MSNPRTGVKAANPDDPTGAEVISRLDGDRIGWLTTVAPDGTPQTSPIWFLRVDDSILMYSVESSRTSNIAQNPRVSLNLDGNGMGGGIVVIEGTAAIDKTAPTAAENGAYLAKYKPAMDKNGWSPEWFAARYCVPVVITPTKYRYW